MTKKLFVKPEHGKQGWDGASADNVDTQNGVHGPLPLPEHDDTLADLVTTHPPAANDRSVSWVRGPGGSWRLVACDGTAYREVTQVFDDAESIIGIDHRGEPVRRLRVALGALAGIGDPTVAAHGIADLEFSADAFTQIARAWAIDTVAGKSIDLRSVAGVTLELDATNVTFESSEEDLSDYVGFVILEYTLTP